MIISFWYKLVAATAFAAAAIYKLLPTALSIPACDSSPSHSCADLAKRGTDALVVRPSRIAGAGLGTFARTAMPAGYRIRYRCTVLPRPKGDAYKRKSAYTWRLNATHDCDGRDARRKNPMRYTNSVASGESCGTQNVEVDYRKQGLIYYRTTRPVKAGEEMLVDYGAAHFFNMIESRIQYDCGLPALHAAAVRGDLNDIREALSDDSTTVNDAEPTLGWTPLLCALRYGHAEAMSLLLDAGADPNAWPRPDAEMAACSFCHPVLMATYTGQPEALRRIIVAGGDANTAVQVETGGGGTALSIAALRGHTRILKLLLEAKASIDLPTAHGASPVMIAAQRGHTTLLKVLLDAGASPEALGTPGANEPSPVAEATRLGHVPALRLLLDAGADVNRVASEGQTAVWIASHEGRLEALRVLLQADDTGVDVARQDGVTPMWVAAQEGHGDIVRLLLKHGASAGHTSEDGVSPVWIAASRDHVEVIKLLLGGTDANVLVNRQRNDGTTPVWIAALQGHASAVSLLLELGADASQADARGITPAFVAERKGHHEVLRMLRAAEKGGAVGVVHVVGSGGAKKNEL